MRRFIAVVFAVAIGLTVVPLPLLAQRRAALTAGATTDPRNAESREPAEPGRRLSPHVWPDADSTGKKPSLGHHLVAGAGIGMATGLAIAIYAETRMTGENMQPLTGPAFGAAAGALLGTVVGWTVYLVRISPPAH